MEKTIPIVASVCSLWMLVVIQLTSGTKLTSYYSYRPKSSYFFFTAQTSDILTASTTVTMEAQLAIPTTTEPDTAATEPETAATEPDTNTTQHIPSTTEFETPDCSSLLLNATDHNGNHGIEYDL